MKWLERLKAPKTPELHATKPTKPQESEHVGGFVGFAAYPPAHFQRIEVSEAANDTTPTADPDRCCWPYSEAMNGCEIDTLMARLSRFTEKGLNLDDSERCADRLVRRDREGDDRRLCFECAHLQGAGPWRCGNWRQADVAREGLVRDLILMLQRCPGYLGVGNVPR